MKDILKDTLEVDPKVDPFGTLKESAVSHTIVSPSDEYDSEEILLKLCERIAEDM